MLPIILLNQAGAKVQLVELLPKCMHALLSHYNNINETPEEETGVMGKQPSNLIYIFDQNSLLKVRLIACFGHCLL